MSEGKCVRIKGCRTTSALSHMPQETCSPHATRDMPSTSHRRHAFHMPPETCLPQATGGMPSTCHRRHAFHMPQQTCLPQFNTVYTSTALKRQRRLSRYIITLYLSHAYKYTLLSAYSLSFDICNAHAPPPPLHYMYTILQRAHVQRFALRHRNVRD